MKQVRRKVRAGHCNEGETYTVKQTVIDGCGCEYYIFVCVQGFHKVTDYEPVLTEHWVDVTEQCEAGRFGNDFFATPGVCGGLNGYDYIIDRNGANVMWSRRHRIVKKDGAFHVERKEST